MMKNMMTGRALPSPSEADLPLAVDHKAFVAGLKDEQRLRVWRQFAEGFWNAPTSGAPSYKTEFMFRRGFFRGGWWAYEFPRNNPELYLSDLQNALISLTNGIYANVVEDRLLMMHVLANYCRVPEVFAVRGLEADEVSFAAQWEQHRKGKADAPDLQVFIKPQLSGARGRTEIASVRQGKFEGFGKAGPLSRLSAIVKDWSISARSSYLFLEALNQGSFTRELFPPANNRLHIIMGRHHDTWAPHLVAAILRVGTLKSAPLDAVESGGLSAWIDVETGTIGDCLQLQHGKPPKRVKQHPDTGAKIIGKTVPNWSEVRATVSRIFDESSYLRICAFDFLLQDDGIALAGARLPDLVAVQIHRPLLTDGIFADQLRKLKLQRLIA
jgi:hypothetical protein